jgi:hypothetical protein
MTRLKLPNFKSEAEEAKWWCDNRELLSDEFERAAKEGRLQRGGIRRLLDERGIALPQSKPLPSTTIRLDPEDIAKARVQAAERGLRYQTYLKMIIHEALRAAETNRQSTAG